MRILLTGATGQIGSALLPLLKRQGGVLAPDRAAFDLSQPKTLSKALDLFRPNLIVNPAAYTAVDRAEDERELAFKVNAEAPAVMAAWAAQHDVPMIHFSTDYVFDGTGVEPWREDSTPNPLSVYGASKLAGDEAIIASGNAHVIVRTSWVYAAKGSNFLNTIVRLAREREELSIVADQIGAPTSSNVIAKVALSFAGVASPNFYQTFARRGGVLNVVCRGETSWHEFASAIVDGLRNRGMDLKCVRVLPIRSEEYPTKSRRPMNSRLSVTRLANVFGIVTLSWREALERELDILATRHPERA